MMALAACGSEEKKAGEGTEVAFNAEGDGGGIKIQTGKDGGKIRIGGDGAAINIDVPDFVDLDVASDFEIDGVKLYPGSTVTRVDVDANDKNGADKATVNIGFTYILSPTNTREWTSGDCDMIDDKAKRRGQTPAGH